MSVRVGINGFGRIGRLFLRICFEKGDVDVVAVNSNAGPETLSHLLKYDSVHGVFREVSCGDSEIVVRGRAVKVFNFKEPFQIPWGELGVDVVVESTGKFRDRKSNEGHLRSGAKKVVITAPGKDPDVTIVMGVNHGIYDPSSHSVISAASCTTNCLAPVCKVILERFGLEKGFMTTVHAYTNDQRLLDKSHKDLRRARAAALSMVPTTTGAAKAMSLVIPQLSGKLDGFAIRVPTPNVSLVDLTCLTEKAATESEVNGAFREYAEGELKGILGYSEEPLVSVDYNHSELSSIVDGLLTNVVGGNMVKVVAWYDNEWGYACRVYDLVKMIADRGF